MAVFFLYKFLIFKKFMLKTQMITLRAVKEKKL